MVNRWTVKQFHQCFTGDSLVFSPILLVSSSRSFTGEMVKSFHRYFTGSPVMNSPPYFRVLYNHHQLLVQQPLQRLPLHCSRQSSDLHSERQGEELEGSSISGWIASCKRWGIPSARLNSGWRILIVVGNVYFCYGSNLTLQILQNGARDFGTSLAQHGNFSRQKVQGRPALMNHVL